jgi:peptidoglycan hydrolase CwlO-like protein
MISKEQIDTLKAKVAALVSDKDDADAKTAEANQKNTELVAAQTAAAQANLDEASADSKVTADVTDLEAFVESLVVPVAPPAA